MRWKWNMLNQGQWIDWISLLYICGIAGNIFPSTIYLMHCSARIRATYVNVILCSFPFYPNFYPNDWNMIKRKPTERKKRRRKHTEYSFFSGWNSVFCHRTRYITSTKLSSLFCVRFFSVFLFFLNSILFLELSAFGTSEKLIEIRVSMYRITTKRKHRKMNKSIKFVHCKGKTIYFC